MLIEIVSPNRNFHSLNQWIYLWCEDSTTGPDETAAAAAAAIAADDDDESVAGDRMVVWWPDVTPDNERSDDWMPEIGADNGNGADNPVCALYLMK